MIETEQRAEIEAGLDAVWDHVRDIARWAAIMPGYRACAIENDNDSRWTLKVGVGGLVRTVTVAVHVEEWAGPGLVRFRYALKGDPVTGSGTWRATALSSGRTGITLAVRVEGSGPMAPMWEAMGRPLLPQFARSFAAELKRAIEAAPGAAPPAEGKGPRAWLRGFCRRLARRA